LKHDCITRDSQETAALYALGALSQHEARAFEFHLHEGCPACDVELKQFEQVAGLLGSTAKPVAPPAYLRELLAVRIQRETPPLPSPSTMASSITTSSPAKTSSTAIPVSSASVIPFREPKLASGPSAETAPRVQLPLAGHRPSSVAWLPWAVAAALLIAFLFTLSALRTDHRSLQAAMDQDKAELREQLAKETAKSTELAEINSVLSSPEVQTIELAGQEPAPDSSARVYWDVQRARWVVTADLPPAPEGKVYQLWFVTPDAKISAGLINPDKNGHGFAVVQFPSSATQLAAAAITLEPEGGSEQPTMPIYALGTPS
jgi:anti-sigma-K factor RskA